MHRLLAVCQHVKHLPLSHTSSSPRPDVFADLFTITALFSRKHGAPGCGEGRHGGFAVWDMRVTSQLVRSNEPKRLRITRLIYNAT